MDVAGDFSNDLIMDLPPQVQSQNVPSPKFKVMAGGTGLRIEVPDVSGMTQVDLHFRQDRGYFVQDFFRDA
jgi:hypothetical protein